MAGEDRPLTDYEKERLSRIRENEARLQALGIRRLAASPLLNQSSSAAAAAKRKQKKRSDDVDEEYRPSDESGGEEEGQRSSASEEDDGEETKSSSRSRQKVPLSSPWKQIHSRLNQLLYCILSLLV
jgi:hypothetical protein